MIMMKVDCYMVMMKVDCYMVMMKVGCYMVMMSPHQYYIILIRHIFQRQGGVLGKGVVGSCKVRKFIDKK